MPPGALATAATNSGQTNGATVANAVIMLRSVRVPTGTIPSRFRWCATVAPLLVLTSGCREFREDLARASENLDVFVTGLLVVLFVGTLALLGAIYFSQGRRSLAGASIVLAISFLVEAATLNFFLTAKFDHVQSATWISWAAFIPIAWCLLSISQLLQRANKGRGARRALFVLPLLVAVASGAGLGFLTQRFWREHQARLDRRAAEEEKDRQWRETWTPAAKGPPASADPSSARTPHPPPKIVQLAWGGEASRSYALLDDDRLVTWTGADATVLGTFRRVWARGEDACAIAADGHLECFVGSAKGVTKTIDGHAEKPFVWLAMNDHGPCVVTSQLEMRCLDLHPPTGVDPIAATKAALTYPGLNTYAFQGKGGLGSNILGVFPLPSPTAPYRSMTPTVLPISPSTHSLELAAIDSLACSLESDGAVWCWDSTLIPARVALPGKATFLGGDAEICARVETGEFYCWVKPEERREIRPALHLPR